MSLSTDPRDGVPTDALDDRSFLQERLARFGRLGFALTVVFFTLSALGYWYVGLDKASWRGFATYGLDMVVAATVWLSTRGRPRPLGTLLVIDVVGTTFLCFDFIAVGAGMPLWARPDLFVLLTSLMVLAVRVVYVPSSAARSGWISGVVVVASVTFTYFAYAKGPLPGNVSVPLYVLVAALFGASIVAFNVFGSRILFGLRVRIREATQLGQYTLAEKIGEGGMGIVYLARHALLRRPTAVKLLPAERAGETNLVRFEREVQMTSLLTHPNTVAVYDFGRTHDGVFYYAMEYLEGVDLEGLVEHDGAQSPARVIHILRQVCGALAEAHGIGLTHRDIKPANILLCERGGVPDVAKVLDFGLVKVTDPSGEAAESATNAITGTPLYMSPEAIVDPTNVRAASDLYALGAVAYFLLTTQHVFEGATLVEVCAHHLHTAPVSPAERLGRPLPDDLCALVLACLEKDPMARPVSAHALAAALAACAVPAWDADEASAWWKTSGQGLRQRASSRTSERAPRALTVDFGGRGSMAAT